MRPRTYPLRMRAALAAVVAMVVVGQTGCAVMRQPERVTLLASWVDDNPDDPEAAAFARVLARFEAETGIVVDYQGTRDVGQVLLSGVRQGNPPDVAVLPRLNDLAAYGRQGALRPLDEVPGLVDGDASDRQLLWLGEGRNRRVYGISIGTSLKSLIWYRPAALAPHLGGRPAPATWDELVELSRRIDRAGGTPWCLGLASPPLSGWPGTDWIEDILLHRSGVDAYRDWAAGRLAWTSSVVRGAWQEWGRTVRDRQRASAALLTGWADAGLGMFAEPPSCHLDHAGSFVLHSYLSPRPGRATPVLDRDVAFFSFPPFPAQRDAAGRRVHEIADDVAGMFTDTPQARRLIRYLASARAQQVWREASGDLVFSLNAGVDPAEYRHEAGRGIARILRDDTLCRDASDLMPAAMTKAFQRAVLEFQQDPGRLDELLGNLEKIRLGIPADEWLDLPCVEGATR